MATYLALTTINAQANGWHIIADGKTRDETEEYAYRVLDQGDRLDIENDTERANLKVVSITTAQRTFGISEMVLQDYWCGGLGDEA